MTVMGAQSSACIVVVLGFDYKACIQPGVMGVFITSHVVFTSRSLILNGRVHCFAVP